MHVQFHTLKYSVNLECYLRYCHTYHFVKLVSLKLNTRVILCVSGRYKLLADCFDCRGQMFMNKDVQVLLKAKRILIFPCTPSYQSCNHRIIMFAIWLSVQSLYNPSKEKAFCF